MSLCFWQGVEGVADECRSHIIMIGLVFAFTLYFHLCNRGKVGGEMVSLSFDTDLTDAECCRHSSIPIK